MDAATKALEAHKAVQFEYVHLMRAARDAEERGDVEVAEALQARRDAMHRVLNFIWDSNPQMQELVWERAAGAVA